jgi:hypothetical protein
MKTHTADHELLDVEHRFWEAMMDKDADASGEMTDDGCIIVGAQGVSAIDAQAMAKMTAEGKWQLKEYLFDQTSTQVRFLTDDIAIIAYPVKERVVVDGKELEFTANDASVWVRRDRGWRCALHTESVKGDPFGRPRG